MGARGSCSRSRAASRRPARTHLRGHRAERRDRLRHPGELGDDEAGSDPAPRGVREAFVQSPRSSPPTARTWSRPRGRAGRPGRAPPGDAAQADQLGRLRADGVGGTARSSSRSTFAFSARRSVTPNAPAWRYGQQRLPPSSPSAATAAATRAPTPTSAAVSEQLGAIGGELIGPGRERRAVEVDEPDLAVDHREGRPDRSAGARSRRRRARASARQLGRAARRRAGAARRRGRAARAARRRTALRPR